MNFSSHIKILIKDDHITIDIILYDIDHTRNFWKDQYTIILSDVLWLWNETGSWSSVFTITIVLLRFSRHYNYQFRVLVTYQCTLKICVKFDTADNVHVQAFV